MDGHGLYSTLHDAYISLEWVNDDLLLICRSPHLESYHRMPRGSVRITVKEPSLSVEHWQREDSKRESMGAEIERQPNWVLSGEVADWTHLGDVKIAAFCPEGVLALGLMELDHEDFETERYLQVIVRGTGFRFQANGVSLTIPEFQKLGDDYWESF